MICVHKDVFPIEILEFFGVAIISIIMGLSTMAGIGGGGIVVPLCMTFFAFTTKDAICISGFSILVCQVAKYIFIFR